MLKSLPLGPAGPWAKLSVWTAGFDHLRPSEERVSTLRHLPSCNSPPAREHKLPSRVQTGLCPQGPAQPGSISHSGCGAQGETGTGKSPPRDPGAALRAGGGGQAAFWMRVGRSGRRGALERSQQAEVLSRHREGRGQPQSRADRTGRLAKGAAPTREGALATV